MKKLIIIIGIFLTIVAAGLYLIQTKIGDIRPALLPASNPFTLTERLTVAVNGDPVDFLTVPSPFTITYFAEGVSGARDLQVSPGGTMLLSQTSKGLVVALPDKNADGISDETKVVLSGLINPHGLAFWQGKLFVAEENKVNRYVFNEDTLTATFEKKLLDLPSGGGHSSRGLVFTPEGKLLITIGSSCNVCRI